MSSIGIAIAAAAAPPAKSVHREKAASALYEHNLLANAGCETADAGGGARGWMPADAFLCAAYGDQAGEWDWNFPGAPGGGRNYFRAEIPEGKAEVSADQNIDIVSIAPDVDAGLVTVSLSAYLGTLKHAAVCPRLTLAALFYDAAGKNLKSVQTAPITLSELPGPTLGDASMVDQSASGKIPPGTRKIVARLSARVPEGSSATDTAVALADNLSVVLK